MKLTRTICSMIADLEYLIGTEFYAPYVPYGLHNVEGRKCSFLTYYFIDENGQCRHPVYVPNSEGKYKEVILYNVNHPFSDIIPSAKTIPHMKYKIGTNEIMIGQGLIKVLRYLEDRYEIDFSDLEKKRKSSKRKNKE